MTGLTLTRATMVWLSYGFKMISQQLYHALSIIRSDLLWCFAILFVVQETQDTRTIRRQDAWVQKDCLGCLQLEDLELPPDSWMQRETK